MIQTTQGNLLAEKSGILVHGCNCQGKMGSGIALQFRQTYPQVYIDYTDEWCKYRQEPQTLLGKVVYTKVSSKLIIASAFTQLYYGNDPSVVYVNYPAIETAFTDINKIALELDMSIKSPRIGAGLANGNWNTIMNILMKCNLPTVKQTVFEY